MMTDGGRGHRGGGGGGAAGGQGTGEHGDPAGWAPRLVRLLEKSCEVCRGLDALSAGQAGVVRSGDTDALMGILSQRQALIDELGGLNGEVEPFRRRWAWHMERLPAGERGRLEGMVGE